MEQQKNTALEHYHQIPDRNPRCAVNLKGNTKLGDKANDKNVYFFGYIFFEYG